VQYRRATGQDKAGGMSEVERLRMVCQIGSIVIEHFPSFGLYHSLRESHKIFKDADLTTGDSIDDLTDIIKDLIEVQWRSENNSKKYGLYQFEFLMKYHSEQHIVSLLKYLKNKNE
jgi:hypothetical protein